MLRSHPAHARERVQHTVPGMTARRRAFPVGVTKRPRSPSIWGGQPRPASVTPMNDKGESGSLPPGQRNVRRSSAPAISVVVASLRDRKFLERCLDSLLPQCAEVNAEVVVARKGPTHELEGLRQGYPWVTLISGPWGSGAAELRAAGMAAASGDVVAIIEDDREVEPNFMRQLTGLTSEPTTVRRGTRGQGGA